MKRLTRLERQTLRDAASRRRVEAEGVNLDRPLPSERDFLVPMRTNGHGTYRKYMSEYREGTRPCQACRDAHSRKLNPDNPSAPDFAEEQWGLL